eukprot:gene23801-30876_t
MWGNRTPLSKKGHALKVDINKWCCTVCMYVENPKDAQNCIVCDSPNYNANKASITKLPIELETQSQALPDYVTQQVLQRTEELRREGRDPRGELSTVLGVTDIFEANDLDRTGMLTVNSFKEIVSKLQLLQSEEQLSRVIEDCLSFSNKTMVVYDDFCCLLELGAVKNGSNRVLVDGRFIANAKDNGQYPIELYEDFPNGTRKPLGTLAPPKIILAFSGETGSSNDERWCCTVCMYTENPKDAQNCLVCDSPPYRTIPNTCKDNQCQNCTMVNGQSAEECEMCGEPLLAAVPAPKDIQTEAKQGDGGDVAYQSPRKQSDIADLTYSNSSSSINNSATDQDCRRYPIELDEDGTLISPSGQTGSSNAETWVCTVCYNENTKDAQNCIVCDSPPKRTIPNTYKDNQCQNCTMLNDQFAEECAMCGEPLLAARGKVPASKDIQ